MANEQTGSENKKYIILRSTFTSWEVYNLTPRTDCKKCGFHSCIDFSKEVFANKSLINLCPYIDETIYWLTPKTNCKECSYPPCSEFVKKVAEGIVTPDNCPYTVENEKTSANNAAGTTQNPKLNEEAFEPNLSVVASGKAFVKEIEKANALIKDETLSNDLDAIKALVVDIFEAASKSASIQRQIRKFIQIYLPMTLKMINLYLELESRKVQTKSVLDAKTELAASIGNAKNAFAKLNDELFDQTSLDTGAEIDAFKSLLEIDGLTENYQMKMPPKKEEKL